MGIVISLLGNVSYFPTQVPMVTGTEFVQGKTKRWGLAWSFDTTAKVSS